MGEPGEIDPSSRMASGLKLRKKIQSKTSFITFSLFTEISYEFTEEIIFPPFETQWLGKKKKKFKGGPLGAVIKACYRVSKFPH